jgi:hypothetical protein
VNVVEQNLTVPPDILLGMLFEDRFGSFEDFYLAVGNAHGYEARRQCEEAVAVANEHLFGYEKDAQAPFRNLLLAMPQHDFMLAVEEVAFKGAKTQPIASRINKICSSRGVPFKFDVDNGFEWVGDMEIRSELVEPALAAIHDPRFAGGVYSEFEKARSELRENTANTRKQAVHEAGCAVESAMKVVLDQRKIAYKATDTGKPLFDLLEANGLVPRFMEPSIFAVLTPRNKTAGHGGGAEPLDPGKAGPKVSSRQPQESSPTCTRSFRSATQWMQA